MFDILLKSFTTGVVTTKYPDRPADFTHVRGRPEFPWSQWRDARPAAAACPTGALATIDSKNSRKVTFDLGKCTFCGLCAEADARIQMTHQCELASQTRAGLISSTRYGLNADGTQGQPLEVASDTCSDSNKAVDDLGAKVREKARRLLGRSLHIREVDAGSCNGCEVEVVGLNSPVYDIERFGIHFVASPRHADMLLVTGPVSRNMELALRKTYDATPEPRLVAAVGACACSGGIFGQNYACVGGVDRVVPVDIYIPGCPPNPHALLHGVLAALGRLEARKALASPTGPS
jgi:Ni,Fe-hydrogenase III small subunit/formate hydrogenlyase subunit 6/NADH:ubiquinone oxidoreductase subunit I